MNVAKISFTGRETMLTKGITEAASKTQEYVRASKIFSPAEVKAAEEISAKAKEGDFTLKVIEDAFNSKSTYTSPFAPTSAVKETSMTQAQKNNYNWLLSHGTPKEEAEAASMHIDINV